MGGLVFITDDARGLYETLKERGVTDFTQEPTDHFYGTDMGIRDPFGNAIRILQQGEAAARRRPPEPSAPRQGDTRRCPTTTSTRATTEKVWTDEERAAMQESARERKAAAKRSPEEERAAGEAEVQAKIAEMPEPDRAMAERIHALVTASRAGRSCRGRTTGCRPTPRTARRSASSSRVEVQGALLDVRLPARREDRRRRHVAGRVRGHEADPGRREADRRAREESGGLSAGPRLGRDRGPRRPREQPPRRQPRHPEAPADRVHRRLGLGQELARLRHDRRRVAAADQRDLQRVRPGLHADAGPARRRLARRADDRDHPRPGADGRQRPLDRRHRHRRQRDAAGRLQPARQAAHRRAPGVLVQHPLGRGRRGDQDRARRRQDREPDASASPAACVRAARAWAARTTST